MTYVRSGGNQVFTYDYDAGGRPLSLTYPLSTGIVAEFNSAPGLLDGWDGNGQLLHLRYVKGASTLRRFEYSYDEAGNRISQLDVTPTKATRWVYGYDWLDRLESVKKAEAATVGALGALQLVAMYTYDAADNRYLFEVPNLSNPALTETFRYSYDDADSITKIEKKVGAGAYSSMETFTSDDDGNLLTRTDVATGVVTSYSWTDFNRLKAISTSDDSKKQSHTFGISGFRRKKKDKSDVETTEYAAGLSTEVSKVTSGETITYLKGGGGIMGLERTSDGAMFYFLTDALSTVRDVVNNSGTVVASYEFDEYGRRIATSETGVSSQKTFVGGMSVQDEVAETGLMMMGHRFYAPDHGRFLNRDPIGFDGGLNLFEYAESTPVLKTDRTGLRPASTPGLQLEIRKCGPYGPGGPMFGVGFPERFMKSCIQKATSILNAAIAAHPVSGSQHESVVNEIATQVKGILTSETIGFDGSMPNAYATSYRAQPGAPKEGWGSSGTQTINLTPGGISDCFNLARRRRPDVSSEEICAGLLIHEAIHVYRGRLWEQTQDPRYLPGPNGSNDHVTTKWFNSEVLRPYYSYDY